MIKKSLILALRIASHLAYMVLIPLLLFGGLGLFADRQFGSLPRWLLAGVALAFLTTIYWLSKRLRAVIEVPSKY